MTHLDDILRSPIGTIPRQWRMRAGTFREVFQEDLGRYVDAVRSVSATDDLTAAVLARLPRVEALASGLVTALDAALAQRESEAAAALQAAMEAVRQEIEHVVSKPLEVTEPPVLYRVRPGDADERFTRAQVLHIPWSMTDRQRRGRYNPARTPVWYIAGHPVTCWHETRYNGHLYAAGVRIRSDRTLHVLNMGYRGEILAQFLELGRISDQVRVRELAAAQVVLWPLYAACGYNVRDEDDAEPPEYRIPQLLAGWVSDWAAMNPGAADSRRPDYLGIRYASTRLGEGAAIAESACFVLPATGPLDSEGHSQRLLDTFELTEPIYLGDLPEPPLEQFGKPDFTARINTASVDETLVFAEAEKRIRALPFAPAK